MGLSKLGLFIAESDKRNSDGKLDENAVVGISTQKELIRTKADLAGVNLSSYKLLPPMSFAYVPDTSRRGEKIALGLILIVLLKSCRKTKRTLLYSIMQ